MKNTKNRPEMIRQAIKANKPAAEIMKTFGVSKNTVAYHKTRLNKLNRKTNPTQTKTNGPLVLTQDQWATVQAFNKAKSAGHKILVQI